MMHDTPTPSVEARPPPQPGNCQNCGAPLYGRYCYACGQPVRGLVRHFGSILSDVADSVLNIDERIFRTLAPLYLRPGRLTLDYFAGRRARYVTPFRLVFFLAIIAFFTIQLTVRAGFTHDAVQVQATPAASHPADTAPGPTVSDTHFANGNIALNGRTLWNRASKPLHVAWLPGFANDWLNDSIENARVNLRAFSSGNADEARAAGRRVTLGLFAAAPTVLFVLLPLFALLLKVFYLFKRRLYMEHLIVAMHSHAFLMLSMLVLVLLGVLKAWLVPTAGWIGVPLAVLSAAAWAWVFVYLFVMQKRIYRQGWFMTGVKYLGIGMCYTVLVGLGTSFAFLLSLGGT